MSARTIWTLIHTLEDNGLLKVITRRGSKDSVSELWPVIEAVELSQNLATTLNMNLTRVVAKSRQQLSLEVANDSLKKTPVRGIPSQQTESVSRCCSSSQPAREPPTTTEKDSTAGREAINGHAAELPTPARKTPALIAYETWKPTQTQITAAHKAGVAPGDLEKECTDFRLFNFGKEDTAAIVNQNWGKWLIRFRGRTIANGESVPELITLGTPRDADRQIAQDEGLTRAETDALWSKAVRVGETVSMLGFENGWRIECRKRKARLKELAKCSP